MKLKSLDSYTKEELYNLLQQDEIKINCLQQEIEHIMETVRLCNSNRGENHGVINNNFVGDDYFNNKS